MAATENHFLKVLKDRLPYLNPAMLFGSDSSFASLCTRLLISHGDFRRLPGHVLADRLEAWTR